MAEDDEIYPTENPVSGMRLPVSGEIGGPISYRHDPATADTDDSAA